VIEHRAAPLQRAHDRVCVGAAEARVVARRGAAQPHGQRRHRKADIVGEPAPQDHVVDEAPAKQDARDVLELLFAPALGLLDASALPRVTREQRRLGHQFVKRAGDAARALDAAPVEHERGHRPTTKADEAQIGALRARQDAHRGKTYAFELEHLAHRERRM
jgi:hypothetical protein